MQCIYENAGGNGSSCISVSVALKKEKKKAEGFAAADSCLPKGARLIVLTHQEQIP